MVRLLILLLSRLSSCESSLEEGVWSSAAYVAVSGVALGRWNAGLSCEHLRSKHRIRRHELLQALGEPKKAHDARDKLRAAQEASARTILKTLGCGALLRGVESVWEQELRYEQSQGDSGRSLKPVPPKRKRAPRVALATASAVIGLLSVLFTETPEAAGLAAALHIGFHGSGRIWKKLAAQ